MYESRVRVKLSETSGPDPSTIIKRLEQKFSKENVQRDLTTVKNKILAHIDMFINSHRVRDRKKESGGMINALRNSTTIEDLGVNKIGLSIGNRDQLTEQVPYWYVLNYGFRYDTKEAYVPPMTTGYWDNGKAPIKGAKGGVFHHTKGWIKQNPYQRQQKGRNKGKPGLGNSYLVKMTKSVTPMHWLEEMSLVFQVEIELLEQMYRDRLEEVTKISAREEYISTISQAKREWLFNIYQVDVDKASISVIKHFLSKY